MSTPDGRTNDPVNDARDSLFEFLGGELSVVDPWTKIDFTWLDDDAWRSREAVGYRGLTMPFRVAGLTLGDADAAPCCPPFLVEIWPDRITAQVFWHRGDASTSRIGDSDAAVLQHWAAGSLTKNLRVVRFGDGDPGLEAELHLASSMSRDTLLEFVTAFSWDIAALHAFETDAVMLTTEEWVTRAALSISRSTPQIPLRDHPRAEWHAHESPRGVFCSLQPGGGVCDSDNVLYAVQRDAKMLVPLNSMPGHRSDWDYARLAEVWLARDGVACFARSLLGAGQLAVRDGPWSAVLSDPITAIALWGENGFLLGLHDGNVIVLEGAEAVSVVHRVAEVTGRFSHLVTSGNGLAGLVGTMLFGARLATDGAGVLRVIDPWVTQLMSEMSFDMVSALDADAFSKAPAIAVLGDDGIAIVDAQTGVIRSQFAVELAQQAKWIGPGWLLVLDTIENRGESQSRLRVLDVLSGRWTEPVVTAEVSRIAVRGDEIHVGYANQSIAVWDRAEVCRGIGAWAFRAPVPEERGRESNAQPADLPSPLDAISKD